MSVNVQPQAAAAIDVVDKHQFAAEQFCFGQRRERSRRRTKGSLVGGGDKTDTANGQHAHEEVSQVCHQSSSSLLLSPKAPVSTPIFCAMLKSRLLMWACGFAGRPQSR